MFKYFVPIQCNRKYTQTDTRTHTQIETTLVMVANSVSISTAVSTLPSQEKFAKKK